MMILMIVILAINLTPAMTIQISGVPVNPIEYSTDDYLSSITCYHQAQMFHIRSMEVDVVTVINGNRLGESRTFNHGIPNAYHEYLQGFCTPDSLVLLKQHVMYFYQLAVKVNELMPLSKYPASYFNVRRFTDVLAVSRWGAKVVIKTGGNAAHLFDFISVTKPRAVELNLPARDKNDEIRIINIVREGKEAALFFSRSMIIVDLMKADKFSVSKQFIFDDEIAYVTTSSNSNVLIVFNKESNNERTFFVMHVDNLHRRQYGSLNNIPLDARPQKIGISYLAYFTKGQMLIYDISQEMQKLMRQYISNVTLPDTILDEGYRFNSTYTHTSLVATVKRTTDKVIISHMKMTGKNELCHPSCFGKCHEPFVICSQKYSIIFSMAVGFAGLLITLIIIHRSMNAIEQYQGVDGEQRNKRLRKAFNNMEIDQSDDNESIVKFRFKLSKMSPSMVEAVHDELIVDNHSDSMDDPLLLKNNIKDSMPKPTGITNKK